MRLGHPYTTSMLTSLSQYMLSIMNISLFTSTPSKILFPHCAFIVRPPPPPPPPPGGGGRGGGGGGGRGWGRLPAVACRGKTDVS